ncbi:MAG: exodeoxyribonuclease VII small subunit [Acidobacteria bacterium]|nr:exodeoxyribonuclease VII small subunit [Acidobacteriota bacterium]MDW7984876.1 exodeoxyribonuclease VII small subunit [Acidobacteriota bacterium]
MEELTFETALERLRKIVQQLESGSLPLETMLDLYEEGKRLSEFCEQKLQEARRRIERLQATSPSSGESEGGPNRPPVGL